MVEQVGAFLAECLFCCLCLRIVLASEGCDQRFGCLFAKLLRKAFDALLEALLCVGAMVSGGLRALGNKVVEAFEGEGGGQDQHNIALSIG